MMPETEKMLKSSDQLNEEQRRFVQKTADYVCEAFKNAEGSHDFSHIMRVHAHARGIAEKEGADLFITEIAALLHDIADAKYHGGDEKAGGQAVRAYLSSENRDAEFTESIALIVENVSFKGGNTIETFSSPELYAVRDADRLDAIGAIGIARTFAYGGSKGKKLYVPEEKPQLNMSPEEYRKSEGHTVNHFYEKLLLLKDRMHTAEGKRLAEERHSFMEDFLKRFYAEWNAEC